MQPKIREVTRNLFKAIPAGVGSAGAIRAPSMDELKQLLQAGARWAIERGYGAPSDLEFIEEGGCLPGSDPGVVSDRAFARGRPQVGTLGSGNHFLEVQYVDEVYWPEAAEKLGLQLNGICLAIHSGSRGFGYQICDDFVRTIMPRASEKYGIQLSDRQLCCAPLKSEEAKRYLAAMACAANYAFVNRQVMGAIAGRIVAKTMGIAEDALEYRLIYDVCHNIAKFETHPVNGNDQKLCVHRKGATRALGPSHPLTPARYKGIGQPVFIPGDMGRYSFVLIGTDKSVEETFGSTCHGAGRQHSRTAMIKMSRGRQLFKEMEEKHGVVVFAHGHDSVAEEMPEAYKDASLVVDVMERAGVSRKVARLRPIGCVKG